MYFLFIALWIAIWLVADTAVGVSPQKIVVAHNDAMPFGITYCA